MVKGKGTGRERARRKFGAACKECKGYQVNTFNPIQNIGRTTQVKLAVSG